MHDVQANFNQTLGIYSTHLKQEILNEKVPNLSCYKVIALVVFGTLIPPYSNIGMFRFGTFYGVYLADNKPYKHLMKFSINFLGHPVFQ